MKLNNKSLMDDLELKFAKLVFEVMRIENSMGGGHEDCLSPSDEVMMELFKSIDNLKNGINWTVIVE